jgi:tripartite-type tricarboxylate transporter receptor subunit TctC
MSTFSRSAARAFSAGVLIAVAGTVAAQPVFPNKPIRIVTSEAGAATDTAARMMAQALGPRLGQPVIVDNRGGAGGTVAALAVVRAPPDGHTLLFYSNAFWIAPLVQENVAFDPLKDFSAVTLAVTSPNVLVVHPSLPVKTVKELIAFAKARPGKLSYASASTGAMTHLSAELFKSTAGIDIVRINYKGAGPGLTALMSGEVQLMFPSASSGLPLAKQGRVSALAISSLQPSRLAPGLPTLASAGLPGFESANRNAMFAPAKTPAAIINRLNKEIATVLNQAEIRERLLQAGLEIVANSPEELAAGVKAEMSKWGRLIKEAGIRGE